MSWSELQVTVNTAVLATFGADVTYTRYGTGATATVRAEIRKASQPLFIDGAVSFSEHRYTGLVLISAFALEPTIGDTLTTADGEVYRLDQPPAHEDGCYRLILSRVYA